MERAATVAQGLLDIARIGEAVSVEDVYRFAQDGVPLDGPSPAGKARSCSRGSGAPSHPRRRGSDYVQAIATTDIVVGIGPAGTGKTYLAVAKVEALARQAGQANHPRAAAVEAGESSDFSRRPAGQGGSVPRPLYDALEDMMPQERVQKALEQRVIEIAPLAYMRGRTNDAFIILDEAQNATGAQMKMFTRLGVNSKSW